MRIALLLVLAAACHKDTAAPAPGGPANTADLDKLWKLAPEGVRFGMVASPRALQMTEHAWDDIHAYLAATPDLAPVMKQMSDALTKALGSDQLSFGALGLSTAKGGAMFMRDDKRGFVVVPLGDRDKFLKLAKGKKGDQTDTIGPDTICETTHNVYVCASDKGMFDLIGKGHIDVAAANARGDIEFAGNDLPVDQNQKISIAAVAQLARGQITWRGSVTGIPAQVLTMMGAASKPRTDGDRSSGFAAVHVKSLLALMPVPPEPVIPGVTAPDLVKSIEDPITVSAQSTTLDLNVPLNDTASWKKLLELCSDPKLASLGAKLVDGACEMPIPNLPGVIVDVWVDGKALHVGQKKAAKGNTLEPSALGKELADNEWQDVFYGRGSIIGSDASLWDQFKQAQQMMPMDMTMMMHAMVRSLVMLNEVGVGVKVDGSALRFVLGLRTGWANPDDVVAKLVALTPDDIVAGKGAELAKPLANGQTPLANDLKAGYPGLMMPSAIVGVLAAVAVPAFMDYMKKSKKTEVELQLNKLGKNLKRSYIETSAFPIGDAPLSPAGGTCCGQPKNKCAVDPAMANDKVWSALDFQLDEPSMYQYRYHSDGKTAVVEAVGDLDCDGEMATFTLNATATNGNPSIDIVRPPAGVY